VAVAEHQKRIWS